MHVNTLAIQHIFEKDVHYRVPLYQRPYVWEKDEQWMPLWEDVQRLAESLLTGESTRSHFLGATVQDHVQVPPGQIETRLVIDGQQRLTSVQLLLKAFRDVILSREADRYCGALEKMIYNDHPLSTEEQEQFKVWPTNADRGDFELVLDRDHRCREDLLSSLGKPASTRAIGRKIPDAYLFFHSEIDQWLGDTNEFSMQRIGALYGAIRDNVRLVVIDLDEKDDAQLIFETLNARGTPLLSADLIKNSLLSEIQGDDNVTAAEKAYVKYWQSFDEDQDFWRDQVGRGHAARAHIELFLKYALTILTEADVPSAHLYTAYRDYTVAQDALTPLERLEVFNRYGKIYRRLQDGHYPKRIGDFIYRLKTMDLRTAYPFLLKLFDVLGDREDLLVEILESFESYLVRRMVCRLSTRGYNRIFVDLLESLDGDPEGIPATVIDALSEGVAEYDRWPGDQEFRKSWLENPLYENLTRPRLRLLLEALEQALRSDFAESTWVKKGLHVEHVMPQSWQEHWHLPPEENAVEATMRRNRAIHTIGNLTLLNQKLNTAQSNRPWLKHDERERDKRSALQEHSVLYLNKGLVDYDQWDEESIAERANQLCDVATRIWRAPVSGESA